MLRIASLSLIAVMSLSNAASGGRLIVDLVRGEGSDDPSQLLLTGGAIWLTNVIVFGLWYWEFDRGGPIERAAGSQPYPDFVFPQMTSPELAPPDWEPGFVDYLYVSFTNAMAFSPTDAMPMTRWAKLTMLTQSLISVVTLVLVIARAVNILHSAFRDALATSPPTANWVSAVPRGRRAGRSVRRHRRRGPLRRLADGVAPCPQGLQGSRRRSGHVSRATRSRRMSFTRRGRPH